jgi:hypothetical protein
MRERLEIAEGDEMEFYVLVDECGVQYVAMTNNKSGTNKYELAAQILTELGLEVPEELEKKL